MQRKVKPNYASQKVILGWFWVIDDLAEVNLGRFEGILDVIKGFLKFLEEHYTSGVKAIR